MIFNKHKGLILCALSFLLGCGSSQVQLLSETQPLFKHPESAVYDQKRDCIYISNMNKETSVDSLFTDFISRMTIDGDVSNVEFIAGLSSPTGLAIYQDQLFAVERNGIAVIDLKTNEIIKRFPIESDAFLNDIAFDANSGVAFISETGPAGKVFKLQNDSISLWLADEAVAETNGLLVIGGHLIAGVNGDGYVKSIDLTTKEITNLALLGTGNIDGIQQVSDGLLVSHFLGNFYHINSQNEVTELLNTRNSNLFIADFAFISDLNKIVVPSLRTNKVYIYSYED